jgi:hypothetical protein
MNSWIISFHNQEMTLAQEDIVFRDDFLSNVARATRSFSPGQPTIVPASKRTIQSFEAMLSGLIGI